MALAGVAKSDSLQAFDDASGRVAGRSLWQDATARLLANRAALVSLVLLSIITVLSFAAPLVLPHSHEDMDFAMMLSPPTLENAHWAGTDNLGRDLLARTLQGGRISITIAVLATSVALVIGITVGAVAGYVGGAVDQLLMRFVDLMYSVPLVFFVIILMTLFGRNIYLLFMAIGFVEWLTMARIVRGQTLTLKNKEFIEAARASGGSTAQIIRRHVVPNVLGVVAVYVTLTIPQVILLESFLSFLGLGVQEPMTSWGALVAEGAAEMEFAPHTLLVPAVFLTTTLFCFNFLGDGLRDALDPKDR